MGRSENVEKYSSSIVALDINTGKDRWVRQTVHHDLWDMDVPAQPVLLDITKDGQTIPALVGPTKQGDIYVLDRRTGEPLLPITEEPAPGGAIPEDFTSPTQPTTALSFKPEPLQEKDMWGVSMFDQARLPHPLPSAELQGPLYAAVTDRLDHLSRQFRHLQLGQRGGRSRTPGHVRHADLSRLHLAGSCRAPTFRRRVRTRRVANRA